jgi:non-ribosomal peptide synthase protein (TIGR01720 family)
MGSAGEFRHFLLDKLPDYMVPSAFILLDAIPVTPNGKIDRQNLPAPDSDSVPAPESAFVAPRTPVEDKLAVVWATVLGLESIGIHDNFFELGGDSILSIQIIAKAAQKNIKLKPNDIFKYPSVAALAGVAEVGGSEIKAQQTAVTGPARLTPIQHWFFEQKLSAPHHWNQSYLLELPPDADLALIERSLQQLFLHHDALRLRYSHTAEGWTQENAGPEQSMRVARFDLSDLPETEQRGALEAEATNLQQSLDLASGGLAQAAIFELGVGQPARLLLVIHHLGVDGISWQILLEDLERAYQQLQQGQATQLPPKTTSFQQWGERLTEFAQSAELKQDLRFWLEDASSSIPPLSPDLSGDTTQNTAGSATTISVTLTFDETKALLQHVPAAYQAQINDALLTALLLSFAERTGTSALYFDLEGHGREALFEEVDLSRTVGWFTAVSPLCLSLEEGASVGEALISVKEQLRRMPRKGLSYGLLRYLSQDDAVREQLARRPQPEITFNYMGQFDQSLPGFSLFQAAPEAVGAERNPHDQRRYLLDINSMIEQGQLTVKWGYSKNCFRPETIKDLAGSFIRNLRSIIEHCTAPGAGGYTPSDFPLTQLSQAQLDGLVLDVVSNSRAEGVPNAAKNIEDIYPLSPMQQLMLLHTLSQPDSGVLFTQMRYTLTGVIDAAALRASWQQIVTRHPALRTAFDWTQSDIPVQVVWQHALLDFEQLDLRHLSPAEQQVELSAVLETDRARGFKLAQPPLMRLTLACLADDVAELIWSSHHLVMDRWCINIILRELFSYYDDVVGSGTAVQVEHVQPFAKYIDWLQQQNEGEAEAFWRGQLAGFNQPTLLVGPATTNPVNAQQTLQLNVPQQTMRALKSMARQHWLTINTLAQGAWALLLSRHCQADDVVFGATVSGRPPDISGVESIVGSLINNVPVRVKIDRKQSAMDWLRSLQTQQIAMQPYEYVAPATVHSWSDVPNQAALFDTLVVFQAPTALEADLSKTIHVTDVKGDVSTIYPFTLSVFEDDDQLRLWATYDPAKFDETAAGQVLEQLLRLFEAMATNIDRPVGDLLDSFSIELVLPEPEQPSSDCGFVAPRSDAEVVLAEIWAEVLGVDKVGVYDHFFDLGGHSLSVTQTISRIREAFEVELPLRTLFEAPTVAELAIVIEDTLIAELEALPETEAETIG